MLAQLTRTAVYGPVRTVVWQGSAGDRRPYADQCRLCRMRHSRHSFATEMLRAGVSLPVLMKLLGHKTPKMTLRYLEVALSDVQREFQLAQLHPRHLAPAT